MSVESLELILTTVSIPHWFDSKRSDRPRSRQLVLLFQFHIGSIQRCSSSIARLRYPVFQFHIGSIQRSIAATYAQPRFGVFQFHIGSIQSDTLRSRRSIPSMYRFNSTLVRFKVIDNITKVIAVLTGFNSTLVRFKGRSVRCRLHRLEHHVSIPHWFDSK